jgi:hypothetical protein
VTVASRTRLRRLDATVAGQEMAADRADEGAATPSARLLAALESDWHCWLEGGRDAIVPAAERAYFWPSWLMLLVFSEAPRRRYPWPPGPCAAAVRAALEAWVQRVCEDVEGKPDDYDPPLPAWQPLNEVTLHQLKAASHWPGRERFGAHGAAAAIDLTDVLRPVTALPPYDAAFPADRAGWPAAVRAAVEAELRKSESLTPAVVPPYDWRDVPRSMPLAGGRGRNCGGPGRGGTRWPGTTCSSR